MKDSKRREDEERRNVVETNRRGSVSSRVRGVGDYQP
jgi:hypothetical protein